MDVIFIHNPLETEQQPKLYRLLGKCFPCWTHYRPKAPFPFEQVSFAARHGRQYIAHCGIIPFELSDGQGNYTAVGGLANVCTDPNCRHMGLAEQLCRCAINWAESEKLAGIPLFTSFQHVYEKNGWYDYPITMPKLARWKTAGRRSLPLEKGIALPAEIRAKIQQLYETGFDFPGKVRRAGEESHSLFSWKHHFKTFEFQAGENCYAAGGDNLVCELNGNPDAPETEEFLLSLPRKENATIFALPENSPFWPRIRELAELEPSDIFFHGPMVRDLDNRKFFQNHTSLYFPLTDRF